MDEKEFVSLLYGVKNPEAIFLELAGKQSLVFIKADAVNELSAGLVHAALARGFSGVYLSLNESFKYVAPLFAPAQPKAELYYIDCVSSLAGPSLLEKEKCILVSGPTSLMELGVAIAMGLKKTEGTQAAGLGNRFLVFNSVNNFLIYNGRAGMSFLRKLLIKLKVSNITGLFLASKEAESNPKVSYIVNSFEHVVRL